MLKSWARVEVVACVQDRRRPGGDVDPHQVVVRFGGAWALPLANRQQGIARGREVGVSA